MSASPTATTSRDRRRDRGSEGGDGAPVAHHRTHAHRLRLAEQGGHAGVARLAARRRGDPADEGESRLSVAGAVLRARGGARGLARGGRAAGARARRVARAVESRTRGARERAAELERRLRGELPAGWETRCRRSRRRTAASRAARERHGVNAIASGAGARRRLGGPRGVPQPALREPSSSRGARRRKCTSHPRHGGGGDERHALHVGVIHTAAPSSSSPTTCARDPPRGAHAPRVIYVFTHDSIGLARTARRPPIEQLTALRCIPNLLVVRRPTQRDGEACPRAPPHDRPGRARADAPEARLHQPHGARRASGVMRGAYRGRREGGATDVVLIRAAPSRDRLAARERLAERGVKARVVSRPCQDLFAERSRLPGSVLPPACRASRWAAHPMSWQRWVAPAASRSARRFAPRRRQGCTRSSVDDGSVVRPRRGW